MRSVILEQECPGGGLVASGGHKKSTEYLVIDLDVTKML